MSAAIDPTSDRPVYHQIADHLRAAILSGEMAPGSKLPSERELMHEYGTAQGTVRQALALLRAEGLTDTQRGRGVFVRERPRIRRLASNRFARHHRDEGKAAFLAEMEAAGRTPEVEVLEIRRGTPPQDVRDRLRLDPKDRVLVRRRRYLDDGEPVELATSYLPLELVDGTPITRHNPGPGGIYARLEDLGHRLERFTEDVSVRMPLPDEVKSLRLGPGVPVFALVRTAFDQDGTPVEVCDTVMAGDRYLLSYELPGR